jgi:hypothetical protein
MKICRLDHVQLAMPAGREDEARAFYQGMLLESEFSPARKAHPAFIVDDLRSLVQSLRSAGYRVVADQPLEGYDRMYVDDPFGNRIELMQRSAEVDVA